GRSEIAGFSTEPYETLQFKATKTDPLSQKISMLSVVQSQLSNVARNLITISSVAGNDRHLAWAGQCGTIAGRS
ncbi:MAG: hypothetical protein ACK5LJ_10950, partial [Paracoccus sp. (in: a-proteobacteria)]